MNCSHTSRLSLALAAAFLAAVPVASAADYYWTGATSGNWTTSTNWDTTPTFGTSAAIFFSNPSAGNLSNFTGAATTVRSLNFTDNQSVTIRTTTTAAGTTAANLTFNGGGSGAFLNVAAGTIANHTVGTGGGGVVLADNLTVNHQGSGEVTINRVVSGTGFGITKTGIGTLIFTQNNTFTGGLTINDGRVRAAGSNTAFNDLGNGTVTLGGGTLEVVNTNWGANNKSYRVGLTTTGGTNSTIEYVNTTGTGRNLTFGTGATSLNGNLLIKNMNVEAGNAFSLSQSITGAGRLIYEGNNDLSVNYSDRRLQISAANGGWSGGFELRKGTANFAGNAISVSGTGTVIIGETGSASNAGLYFNPGQTNAVTTYVNDFIVRAGNSTGAGLRSLRGDGGNATIDAGFLFTGNVTLEGSLNIDMLIVKSGGSSKNMQFNGNITGGGGVDLTKSGDTGDFIGFGGNNIYSGNTTINAGVELRLNGTGNSVGDTSAVTLTGVSSQLRLHNADETIGSLSSSGAVGLLNLAAGNLTTGGNNQSTTYSGTSSAAGGITKTGNGTFTVNAAQGYTGATTINQGVFEATILGNGSTASSIGNSTNAAANLVLNGGTLRFSGTTASTTSTDRLFTVSANSTIDASGTGNSAALVRFTNAGDIAWGTTGQDRTLTLNAGTVGNNIIDSRITDNGAGAVTIVKEGGGNWQFTANNTYSGGTVINGGFLRIGASTSSGTVGSGQVTLNGGTLSSGRIDTFELNNLITGNGTVHMNNTGVMVLTNNNTYSGTTNVNFSGGTIQMGNGSTSGSTAPATCSSTPVAPSASTVPTKFSSLRI